MSEGLTQGSEAPTHVWPAAAHGLLDGLLRLLRLPPLASDRTCGVGSRRGADVPRDNTEQVTRGLAIAGAGAVGLEQPPITEPVEDALEVVERASAAECLAEVGPRVTRGGEGAPRWWFGARDGRHAHQCQRQVGADVARAGDRLVDRRRGCVETTVQDTDQLVKVRGGRGGQVDGVVEEPS